MNNIKKLCVCIVLVVCIFLSGCSVYDFYKCFGQEITTIEQYDNYRGQNDLTIYMLPGYDKRISFDDCYDYLKEYPYNEGDFYLREDGNNFLFFNYYSCRSVILLRYDEKQYIKAKETAIKDLCLTDKAYIEKGSYKFYSNQLFYDYLSFLKNERNEIIDSEKYIMLFGYSDEKKSVISIGIFDLYKQLINKPFDAIKGFLQRNEPDIKW